MLDRFGRGVEALVVRLVDEESPTVVVTSMMLLPPLPCWVVVDTKVVMEPLEPLFELGLEVIRLPDPDDDEDAEDEDDDRLDPPDVEVEDAEEEEPDDEEDPLA